MRSPAPSETLLHQTLPGASVLSTWGSCIGYDGEDGAAGRTSTVRRSFSRAESVSRWASIDSLRVRSAAIISCNASSSSFALALASRCLRAASVETP